MSNENSGTFRPDCCSCGRSDQVVEAPEAGYWICERCGERGSGTEEPIWWRNDPDSQWYVESDTDEDDDREIRTDGGTDSSVIEHPGRQGEPEPCGYCGSRPAVEWSDQGRPQCAVCSPSAATERGER